MASVEELIVKITSDNTGLKRNIDESQAKVNGFGSSLKGVGAFAVAGFAVAGAAVMAFGKQAYAAWEVQAQANRRLLAAVKGNTTAFKELESQASSLQQALGVDDDAVIQIQTLASSAGKSIVEVRKLTEAALYLSKATGQDMQSAYMQINQTFNGTAGRLTRLDAEFGTLSKQQLQNGDAVDLVITKYKALAIASTTSADKVKQNWGEVKENFGKVVAPGVNSILESINTNLRLMTDDTMSFGEKMRWAFSTSQPAQYNAALKTVGETATEYYRNILGVNAALAGTNQLFAMGDKQGAVITPKTIKGIKDGKDALDLFIESINEMQRKADELAQFDMPLPTFSGAGMTDITGVKSKGIKQTGDPTKLAAKSQKELGTAIKNTNSDLERQTMIVGGIAGMFGDLGSAAKMAFDEENSAYQLFAIANAGMSTYLAATAALAPPPMGYGPVAGIPAAIGITAMGLANIGQIAGAFAMGGIIGGGSYSGDRMTAKVNSGEMILNGNQQRELFAMANGMGGKNQVEVVGVISGDVIRLMNKRSNYLVSKR